jgi:hypothetical protein
MKAHIGVDADDSGLVHTVTTTAANEADAYEQSRKDRKKLEPFGHLKRITLERRRLRGLNGARDECLMTAAVQNL